MPHFFLTGTFEELRRDWYVVLVAVERVGRALLYADESLKHDRNFVLEAHCQRLVTIESRAKFRSNRVCNTSCPHCVIGSVDVGRVASSVVGVTALE